jgi:RimJ/RimL family protein N-acetyltransferase
MTHHLAKDGREFIIRRPMEKDAEALISYSKELFASTDQVLTTLEEYTTTIADEKTWIRNLNETPNATALVAEVNDSIIGLLFFIPNSKKKNSHTGEFGVSVHSSYQGIGIGRALIEKLIKWANDNDQVEKVYLNVFSTNHNAIRLYKSLGFIEEGRHIKAARQLTGGYIDVLQMYIETK